MSLEFRGILANEHIKVVKDSFSKVNIDNIYRESRKIYLEDKKIDEIKAQIASDIFDNKLFEVEKEIDKKLKKLEIILKGYFEALMAEFQQSANQLLIQQKLK